MLLHAEMLLEHDDPEGARQLLAEALNAPFIPIYEPMIRGTLLDTGNR